MTDTWERCDPACEGYFASHTDGAEGHADIEIQRCDECNRFVGDDDAAVQFVRDLENGGATMAWAIQHLAEILTVEGWEQLHAGYAEMVANAVYGPEDPEDAEELDPFGQPVDTRGM